MLLLMAPFVVAAQNKEFPFGKTTYAELDMKGDPNDTSAVALVLNELGNSYFNDNWDVVFEYHTKIKILKQAGVEKGNVEIQYYTNNKSYDKREQIRSVRASSFNLEGGRIKEVKLDDKGIFTQDLNEYWSVQKFAIPNVRVGSVIEYSYTIVSPFFFNFRNWDFQSDIPKQRSTYFTSIPGNFQYNITLRGFLKLSTHLQSIKRACVTYGSASADCADTKYEMLNVPAFREEEYMSARSNYLATLNFQLSEVKYFDGRVDKYTKEWKDTDQELRTSEKLGGQIKRAGNAIGEAVKATIAGETDDLAKAKRIYDMVKFHYVWNEFNDKYSESVRKAFDNKTGNAADINLTLVVALREARLQADPVILSTRSHGLPVELHPVMSDFNYVIARLMVNGKQYLLDATDDLMPFGTLPVRCLNGKGRVLPDEGESFWIPLQTTDKDRTVTSIQLTLDQSGVLKGKVSNTYFGYAAVQQRRRVLSQGKDEYLNKLKSSLSADITNLKQKGVDTLERPVEEYFEVSIDAFDGGLNENLLLNPFIVGRTDNNPFKASERIYPVDFGVSQEENITVMLEFPAGYQVVNAPESIALALPGNGGRYIYGATLSGNRITINHVLSIARTIYTSQEYHYLKELFSRMIQAQSIDLILQKKK